MQLLFIKLKHIGDALIMTPMLTAVRERYPEAEIHVVVRHGTEGILAGCPAIDHFWTTTPPSKYLRQGGDWRSGLPLVRQLRQQKYDIVFELSDGDRGRWISAFCRARHRCTNTGVHPLSWFWKLFFNQTPDINWLAMHRVEKDYRTVNAVLPLDDKIPSLTFAKDCTRAWPAAEHLSDFILIHPATRWRSKHYSEGKWVTVCQQLLEKVPRLVLSCGPDEDEIAATQRLKSKLGERVLFTEGKLDWQQVAGLLYRAKLFVGVDTAAMHLAAACQCPTVAVFGPSVSWYWRPWKVASEIVTTTSIDKYSGDLNDFVEIEKIKTTEVCPTQVIAACERLLSIPYPRHQPSL